MDNTTFMPVISIGVPVYNGEAFMKECLESIQNQTYTNWECIIVDNRSTDNTAAIVKSFERTDPRFKLVSYTEFVSLIDNWNRLYANFSEDTKYVKFVQADDWITPTALEDMLNMMEKHPDAGTCFSYRIDGKTVNCDGLDYYAGPVFSGRELLKLHIDEKIELAGSITTPMFRKELFKQLPSFPKIFDDSEYHIDTRLVYEMLYLADAVFVFKILSYTRWHEGAETLRLCFRFNTFMNGKEHRLFRFKHIDKKYENLYANHRMNYAYYLFKQHLKGNKDCLAWHEKFLPRPITSKEYLFGMLSQNGITYRIKRLLRIA